ncbi:MAG: ATP-binding protein [Candidatus Anstonellaceae archaeon]
MVCKRLLSDELASRFPLSRPPEPASQSLVSNPSKSIYIGKTKFLHVPVFWDPEKLLNPHICVVGITGSGKSYFVKTFITRARLTFSANALILDWAGEYSSWVKAAGGEVVSFGKEGINLLDLGGTTAPKRIKQVMEALEIITDISSFPAQKRITQEAIEKAYNSKKKPTLKDVQRILERKGAEESKEAAFRIKNLIFSSGKSFIEQSIDLNKLTSGLVCVDLHSLASDELRSLAGLAILQFIKERMRVESLQERAVRLFVVCDEAWKIAADSRSEVVSIIREGRKYGFSLIVASQNPTDIHRSIFACAGTVLAFRLTSAAEREYLKSSLSYSDFFEKQSHFLSLGQPLVHMEFALPQPRHGTFLLEKVEGEEPLVQLSIRGDGMDLEFEKEELLRKLISCGLTDRQAKLVLSEFARNNYSLSASQFVFLIEKFGYGRPFLVSLLRELGAEEKDIIAVFSSVKKIQQAPALLVLEER